MPTDKKTAFAQGQGGLNLDPTAAAAASGTEAPPGTPAPTAPGAAAPAFGTKRPGETQTATGAFGSKATPFGGGGAAGAGGALSKPFGGAGAGALHLLASGTHALERTVCALTLFLDWHHDINSACLLAETTCLRL